MTDQELSEKLLELLGGKENIISNFCCMTRLRVCVKDLNNVNISAIKDLEDVLGVVENDTLQIVLGPGKATKVLEEFSKLTGIVPGSNNNDNNISSKNSNDKTNPIWNILKRTSNAFITLMPGTVAAGFIIGLTNVINVATNNAFANAWWYQAIYSMGWVISTYFPILVGYTVAKEFGGTGVLGAIAGMMCIYNSEMPLLSTDSAILLPFTNLQYDPSSGGLVATIITAAFFAIIERQIRKHMPNILDTFLSPLLVLIIESFALTLIIQPVGAFLTKGIYSVLSFIYDQLGIIGGYLLSAEHLALVSVGLHHALTPIHSMLNDPNGATNGINYLLPILMMAGGGQVGAGIALYLKCKNKKLRKLLINSIPIGILGIGEPLMYSVTLPLIRPFITASLGAGFGGALASFLHIGSISQGISGLLGVLIIVPEKQISFLLCMLVAYGAGFILTWFFGIDEQRINEFYR